VPGDEAFLAGLVQDIGVLALVQQLGPSYQQLLSHVQSHGGSLLARELDTLGFDHLVLSARLMGHWGLPSGLCAAISVPPDEARIDELSLNERTLPRILHLADLLARLIDQPFGGALRELLAVGWPYCELTYETLQPIVESVQHKVSELADVLSLQLPAGQSYVDLLLAAQARLADETVSVAAAIAAPDAEEQLLALAGDLRSEMALAARRGSRSRPAKPITIHHPPVATPARQRADLNTTVIADPTLATRVTAALQHCRQARVPFTLSVFEIDRFSDILVQLGPAGIPEIGPMLQTAVADWANQRNEPLLISDSRLAMLLVGCSRNDAVRLARSVLDCVGPWSREQFGIGSDMTLSIGLATLESVPKNCPAGDLIEAAQRCLGAAQLSGGNTVKSIEF
jgi:GGDEF domain-containing protein